jgi:hypothetical protein
MTGQQEDEAVCLDWWPRLAWAPTCFLLFSICQNADNVSCMPVHKTQTPPLAWDFDRRFEQLNSNTALSASDESKRLSSRSGWTAAMMTTRVHAQFTFTEFSRNPSIEELVLLVACFGLTRQPRQFVTLVSFHSFQGRDPTQTRPAAQKGQECLFPATLEPWTRTMAQRSRAIWCDVERLCWGVMPDFDLFGNTAGETTRPDLAARPPNSAVRQGSFWRKAT